jgi:hypothetical protein
MDLRAGLDEMDLLYCSLFVLMMEAVSTSETSVYIYHITQSHISEDSLLPLQDELIFAFTYTRINICDFVKDEPC